MKLIRLSQEQLDVLIQARRNCHDRLKVIYLLNLADRVSEDAEAQKDFLKAYAALRASAPDCPVYFMNGVHLQQEVPPFWVLVIWLLLLRF